MNARIFSRPGTGRHCAGLQRCRARANGVLSEYKMSLVLAPCIVGCA
jgi:hypothetical protein